MKKSVPTIINGILLVTAGVLLILAHSVAADFVLALGVLFIAYGITAIVLYLLGRRNSIEETMLALVGGILALVLGIFLVALPRQTDVAVEKATAAWLVLSGLVYLLNTYTYRKSNDSMWMPSLAFAAAAIGMGIALWCYMPLWDIWIGVVIPVYLVLAGLSALAWQFCGGAVIPQPVLADLFLPRALMEQLRRGEGGTQGGADPASGDVEILVHLSRRPDTFWGHVDIAFGDHVFSYGNYDRSKRSLRLWGLLGDGVFVIARREAYIGFAIRQEEKTIFGYQLALGAEERQRFAKNVKRFLLDCVPWEPEEEDKNTSVFAWGMKERGGCLYKVVRTGFRTFSGVGPNCALLAETLLEGTGAPRVRSAGGIVTPGAMLSLLEKELYRKNSIVVSKKEYDAKTLSRLKTR